MPASSSDVLVGNAPQTIELRDYLRKVARSSCNVLITGETGTGKELVAKMIHSLSPRAGSALVCCNCAAVPDSLFETELFGHERGSFTGAWQRVDGRMAEANGGTLFLDEIGEMTLNAQAKVLRAIETRQIQRIGAKGVFPVDVRIVAATNQDLEAMVGESRFRKDLYFRLNVARVAIAPLRDRPAEILDLANHFLARCGALESTRNPHYRPPEGFSAEVQAAFLRYPWPGNIRELKNVVEAALIHEPHPLIELAHLPEMVGLAGRASGDREKILHALRVSNWNKSKAAKQLRWSRMTLYRKMAQYDIDAQDESVSRAQSA